MVCICSSSCAIALDARLSLRGLAGDTAAARRIEQVRDSHEALRDEVERLTRENERIKEWAEATIAERDAVIAQRVEQSDEARTAYVAMTCERDAARRAHVEAETVLREVMDAEAWDDPSTRTHETVRSWLDDRVLVARADAVLAGRAWNDDGEVG